MKLHVLFLLALASLASPCPDLRAQGAGAAPSPGAKAKPPCEITLFQHTALGTTIILDDGNTSPAKCFKVQFKIRDEAVTELPIHRIYLYNDKKELTDVLQHPCRRAKKLQGIPNLIAAPVNLEKGVAYSLLFTYPGNEIKWRYAVAVFGTPKAVVAEVSPHGLKPEAFGFKEKALLVASDPP